METFTIQAIYKDGMLLPKQELDLPDDTPVEIQVTPVTSDTPELAAFVAEVAAFERLKPDLLKKYPGQAVAIYQGQVVAVGNDKMTVLAQVQDQLGDVRCYIEWVEFDAPRRAHVPSVWIARQ